MTDYAKQVGKELWKQGSDVNDSLRRNFKKKIQTERVVDTFDSVIPFEMNFQTKKQNSTIKMGLIFRQPAPTACCANDVCSICEAFTAGDEVIQLSRPYISGSIQLFVEGINRTTYVETDQSQGIITLTILVSPGTVVRVCYNYIYE